MQPARGLLSGARSARIDAYGLGRLDDMSPLFDDLYAAARTLGLPVRTLMSEYAPGQFEITLEHRADALRAVDEAVMFKRAVRGVAARHGCIACFMAKPFAELAGAGMHLHASLADADGPQRVRRRGARRIAAAAARDRRPARDAGRRHGGVRAARQFLSPLPRDELRAGRRDLGRQQSHGQPARAGGSAVEPARRASRRRRGRQSVPRRRRRCSPACCAASSASIDPGPPVEGNGYAQATADGLPTQWHAALERAARSEFLADALGAGFLDVFLALKRRECEKFGALVTDRDYEWYLDSV